MKARSKKWQLQEAKNRLSQLVDDAVRLGPQVITRRGRDEVVVLSTEHYERMARRPGRLIDVLRKAPRLPGGLEVQRDDDPGRDVDL
jgi:antitoxin Phd